MPKLLITRNLPETVLDAARERFDVEVRTETKPMTVGEARAALWVYDAILPTLGDGFREGAFDEPPRTRILANFGVGYNHIDVPAARAVGIEVTNTPGAVTDATADIAMTLILMTCRRAGEGERLVRADKWEGWHPTQLLGMHVSGKTQGGFGMKIVFHNRSRVDDPGVEAVQMDTLAEVMAAADIVVLAVPATSETKHLIDAGALEAMKPTGVLVNISRGDVVDEAWLIRALGEGTIAGAGLDVYEFEPKVPDALKRMENVTLLPHLGTAALEVREAMGLMAVENLIAVFDGRPAPNPV